MDCKYKLSKRCKCTSTARTGSMCCVSWPSGPGRTLLLRQVGQPIHQSNTIVTKPGVFFMSSLICMSQLNIPFLLVPAKPTTPTCQNPYPWEQVYILGGMGTGSPGNPQGYPWQSLIMDTIYYSQYCTIIPSVLTFETEVSIAFSYVQRAVAYQYCHLEPHFACHRSANQS